MMEGLMFRGQLYEYKGVITQLAGSSEVANIGLEMLIPTGERILLIHAKNTINDLSTGKDVSMLLFNASESTTIAQIGDSLDNNYHSKLPLAPKDGLSIVNPEGFYIPTIMGGGMKLKFQCAVTLDAEKTMTIRILYWSREGKATFSASGAGISISGEVHIAI